MYSVHVGLLNFMDVFMLSLDESSHTLVIYLPVLHECVLNDTGSADHYQSGNNQPVMTIPKVVELEQVIYQTSKLEGLKDKLHILYKVIGYLPQILCSCQDEKISS